MSDLAGRLHAGAAELSLTPNLGCHLDGHFTDRVATDLHDELFARAVVLDNGQTRIGIVCCDLIIVTREMADAVKAQVAAEADIAPEHLLVCATHTHSGPAVYGAFATPPEPEYAAAVPTRIADAVVAASRRLQPADLGWAVGACPSEVHNRRGRLRSGEVRMNPGPCNPELVEIVGPTDPTLAVMVIRDEQREPIAVLANLALHYVGGPGTDLSSDYFGEFGRALQRCAGRRFVTILTNGCFGDINNVNLSRPPGRRPHPYYAVERVANVCAGEAWRAWNTLWEEDFEREVALAAVLAEEPLTPRRPTAEQVAAAKVYLATHTIADSVHDWCYAREHVLLDEQLPPQLNLPLQALRVGSAGIIGLPGEVFCEIGLAIRAESPFGLTVPIGLANATVGYVAPDHQMDWGGYEVTLCRHVIAPKGTAQCWTATARRLLEQVATTNGSVTRPA